LVPWIPAGNSPISFPVSVTSSSPEETFALGEALSVLLKKGDIVALKGPLGAGKTCFVKGIARGLGVKEDVTSPTYTIVSEYEASPPPIEQAGAETAALKSPAVIYHIDAYRLRGNDDFTAIGGEDIIFADGISLIEWSERIEDFIPAKAIRVDIAISEDGKRLIRMYRLGA